VVLTAAPFNDAVIVWAPEVVPAVTVKVAEAAPDGTMTFPGTVRTLPLPPMLAVTPPLPAACVNCNVQVAVAPRSNTKGAHVSDAGRREIDTVKEALAEALL
jgi:hypothetical protein